MRRKIGFIPQMRMRTEGDDPRLIARQNDRYKMHLDSFNHRSSHHRANASVYRYFGMDLFHDGPIEGVEISSDFRTLRFRIMAPYISRIADPRGSRYFWFRCEFSDISFLHIGARKVNDINNPLGNRKERVEYNVSEINTMKDELAFFRSQYECEFSSLIVDTHPTERSMSFIFRKGSVQPEKPLAFERLYESGKYHLYLYERHSTRTAKKVRLDSLGAG